jgi:hypothetical protein
MPFHPKIYLLPWERIKKIIRFLNKCSKIMIYLFSKFNVRDRRSFVKKKERKKEKKRKKREKRKKKKSMISMPKSLLLSLKKGERRYPKTSTVKFFINFLVGGSLSRSKVELG